MEPDFVSECGGERAAVWVHTRRCDREVEAREALSAGGGSGWVCGRSETPQAWRGGALPTSTILSAEVLSADGQSVHVRFSGDAWLVTTVAETPISGASGPVACAAFDEEVLSSVVRPRGGERPRLTYRTYWSTSTIDGVAVWRPWLSRFTGWRGLEGGA